MTAVLHLSATTLRPLHGLARWWQRVAQARRARDEMAQLAGLHQHELNDLGIGRSELPSVLKPQR